MITPPIDNSFSAFIYSIIYGDCRPRVPRPTKIFLCNYASIMLDAYHYLLCSILCKLNPRKPSSSSTGIQHFLDPKSDSDTPVRNRTYSNTISAKCVFINCKDISVSTVSMLQSSMYIITIMHLCFCFAVVKKKNGNIHQ